MHQTTSNTTEVFEKFVRALPLEKVTLTEPEGLHLYGVRHRVPDRKALQAAIFKRAISTMPSRSSRSGFATSMSNTASHGRSQKW